ncbi:MAG: S46 family peptidase [Bacteroidales bacterium]|nr:S46 family peptidase [Candidatus Cryptobacteroides faecihippi]
MRKATMLAFILLCSTVKMSADEGMWMLKDVSRKVQSYAEAVVSIDFMGTGSLISDKGLVITNHHVAYGDIFELSSAEHNYLEDGFWARSMAEEIPIPGRHIQILQETIDVTDEVERLYENGTVRRGPMSMRRMSGIIEKKYEQETGLTASLGTYWSGSRYYVSLYKEYSDIRLVAAPPVSIGAFGGDIDNWEWPQQKCDFAMLRIYTAPDGSASEYSPENVPLHSPAHLKISDKGYRKGSKTIVIGYPGRTDRTASSSKVEYLTDVTLPIMYEVRGGQMEIIKKWMDADPSVRLKYSDYFFNMSNAQELYGGEILCYKRFGVADEKRELEKELSAWIAADKERTERWGSLLADIEKKYKAVTKAELDLNWFRETMIRGTRVQVISSRIEGAPNKFDGAKASNLKTSCAKTYEEIDLRVERDIFRYTLEQFYTHVDKSMWGSYQKELRERFGNDYDAICAELWDGSWMTDRERCSELFSKDSRIDVQLLRELQKDKLFLFFRDARYTDFNGRSRDIQGERTLLDLDKEYTKAVYQMRLEKKERQYPNANSTLRVSFGKVGGYSPKDALWCDWKSTAAGILEKHDPASHDFCLKPEWRKALEAADRGLAVDFLSDNDITGGNSGSPVLNSKGELIGLAFDGNKESLACDISFTEGYNKCINADIRFVLWTLRNYAHLDNILEEIKK